MKSFILNILFIFIGILGSIFFVFCFGAGDIADYIITRSIPHYPNASRWEVSANSGFPDGRPSGSAEFLTDNVPQTIYDFYKIELPKKGWMLEPSETINDYKFTKTIWNQKYSLYVVNRNNLYHKSTDFWWNWYISIHHDY